VPYEPDGPLPKQFFPVHGVQVTRDDLVYVCDRQRNRIQVFTKKGEFVREAVVAKDTPTGFGVGGTGFGSVFRLALSADPQQQFLYVADAMNGKVWILNRQEMAVLGSVESRGCHHLAGPDSQGNLYATGGRRPQKLVFKGLS
jgi:DNA-binding beta-propeller fold protein YncE